MTTTALSNKWVLITGASSGFGAAAAVAFGRTGAKVVLGARRADRLARVAEQARQAGAPVACEHVLDVASTASVEAFAAWVRTQTASIDVLVNNAGGAHGADPVAQAKDADWEAMFQSNVLGLLRVTRAMLPLMTLTPGAYILNIGSVAGHTAYEGGAAYCAAKAAERQITKALRLEVNGTGVRVGTLDPGLAETEFAMVRFKGDAAKAKKVYEGLEPLTAEDIADAMVWMASRPAHVCIDEVIIKPTAQAEVYKIHRRPAP
jgi:3-hydroxy acid dehydrogenase / malonic semialdehyde reductase